MPHASCFHAHQMGSLVNVPIRRVIISQLDDLRPGHPLQPVLALGLLTLVPSHFRLLGWGAVQPVSSGILSPHADGCNDRCTEAHEGKGKGCAVTGSETAVSVILALATSLVNDVPLTLGCPGLGRSGKRQYRQRYRQKRPGPYTRPSCLDVSSVWHMFYDIQWLPHVFPVQAIQVAISGPAEADVMKTAKY